MAPEPRTREEPGLAGASPSRAELLVEVVDASGEAAGGLSLACGVVPTSAPDRFETRARRRTDADGSARFALSELSPPASPTDRPAEPLRLRAEILAQSRAEVVVDPAHPEERVVLRLPPAGSVRLRATDEQGRVMATPTRFGVWARPSGATADIEPLPRWIAAEHGEAVLEHVGLGLELRVAAALEGGEARATRITASGPRFHGDERVISVPLGAPWPTVLVRALDEHGAPLRNELLSAELKWDRRGTGPCWVPERSEPLGVRTDADGRARFPLHGTVTSGATRRLVLTHGDATASSATVLRSAERDLSWDVAPGDELDLGDVELRPRERETAVDWVAGRVTDHEGNPVANATVLATAIASEGASLPVPSAQVGVDPDGRFAVTGAPLGRNLSVRAVAPGFLRSPEEVVAPGARGLRIRMRAAASWSGRLLLDGDVSPDGLVVEVITPQGRLRTIPTSERILMAGLEPGWIDVEVRTRACDWLVERRERLATHPAATPSETRMVPLTPDETYELDLRGRLTRLRLRLCEPDGTALDRVLARAQPDPWPAADAWILAGRLELLVPSSARALTLRPRGYPPISVQLLSGMQELTCGPRLLAPEGSHVPMRADSEP